jgi:transcriptional regulator with XRE-family HTH domain
VQPESLGFARGERRRVPGLRREEVALRAGVSTTWYTWLEQGRDIKPGPDGLDAVCRALGCDEDERRYVRRLAKCPIDEPYERPDQADPALVDLLDDLMPNPACVATESYDLLAWNEAYATVLSDPAKLPPDRRNVMWMAFLTEIRQRTVDWSNASKAGIAFARAQVAKHPDNHRFREMISVLCDESEEFRAAWALQEVGHPADLVHAFEHEVLGEVRFRILQFTTAGHRSLNVIVFQPWDEEARARLVDWLAREHAAPARGYRHVRSLS